MNIVLCGKKGKLGSVLNQHLSKNHNLVALGREDIDFCDEIALRKKIISLKPEIIISLVIMIIAATTSKFLIVPFIINNTKAVATRILSAIGSSNSPSLDSSLNILASSPSR